VQGVVFVDANANALRDRDEGGLSGIRVRLGKLYAAVTDRDGYYILPGPREGRRARVYLELASLPAIYSPVHASQMAYVDAGAITEVNLAVTPLISVTGYVRAARADGTARPAPGMRVVLSDPDSGGFVADSVTASDGSYYLGDVRPGTYVIAVDPDGIPEGYKLQEAADAIRVLPRKDFQDIRGPDFLLIPTRPRPSRPAPKPKTGSEPSKVAAR